MTPEPLSRDDARSISHVDASVKLLTTFGVG